jgi:chromate transporter
VLYVLPGMVALLALSAVYGPRRHPAVAALFTGLGAAVVAIVAQAVVRVAGRALTHPLLVGLAVAAFVALAVFCVPFPIVITLASGGSASAGSRRWRRVAVTRRIVATARRR